MAEGDTTAMQKPTKAWYLLPIFLSIIGGLIMYFVLRKEDSKMARNGLILGIILTAAGIVISVAVSMYTLTSMR